MHRAQEVETPSTGVSSNISTKPSTKLTRSNEAISMLGRKFGVMNEPFLTEVSFLKACPSATSAKERYKSSSHIADGIVFELYAIVPPEYHAMMQTSAHFYKTVSIVIVVRNLQSIIIFH